MSDFEFILAIKDLKTISQICANLGIDYSNLIKGKSTAENEKRVANVLRLEIFKAICYVKGCERNGK